MEAFAEAVSILMYAHNSMNTETATTRSATFSMTTMSLPPMWWSGSVGSGESHSKWMQTTTDINAPSVASSVCLVGTSAPIVARRTEVMMGKATAIYKLTKDGTSVEFRSEAEACEYLGVKQCTVASCCRSKCKCKGHTVERVGLSTHDGTGTRLYKIWRGMIERCCRPAHAHYKDYGGRGITVCDEWKEFVPFRDWANGNGYADSLTIDRKDHNGNYCPENCRWSTMKEQQNNKRNNHLVTLNGVSHTITEWSEILGIKKTTIKERLKCGWTDEQALTTPVRKRKGADMRPRHDSLCDQRRDNDE